MPRQRDLESLKQKLKRNALKNNRAEFIVDMVLVLFIFNTTQDRGSYGTISCQILHFRTTQRQVQKAIVINDMMYSAHIAHLKPRGNGVAMAKENVVAARKNATFSSTLDAVGIFFPINDETNREANIAARAKEIKFMEQWISDSATCLY